jgi:GT2 family glycosyltransferase
MSRLKATAAAAADLFPFLRRWRQRYRDARVRKLAAIVRASGLFDENWYLEQYPQSQGADPIVHYLTLGAAQGFDPSQTFSTRQYLENYPDIGAAGLNPFLHYVLRGRHESRSGERRDYQTWIKRFDTLTAADVAVFRAALTRFPGRPLISILMPVHNTPAEWLTRAIESVLAQVYPDWQLCISDDASTASHVRETLESYRTRDSRIRVFYRERNGDISANANSALTLASGDFVSLLDAGDELRPHSLFWVASEIGRHPEADIIYSDEDRLDEEGNRCDAHFKPDWNPALILSANYVGHLGTYRRSLVEQVGGFRTGFEGSQYHDLLLRCAALSAPKRIRHIPRVLYHRRSVSGSTTSTAASAARPGAWEAGARSIKEHLGSRASAGNVERALKQFYQVDYRIGGELPKVSVVMPTTGTLRLFAPCVRSLLAKTTYPNFELVIAISEGHAAIDERREYLQTLQADSRVRVLVHAIEPYSFAAVNNLAARRSAGSVFCFLNDDVEIIDPDWLERLVVRLQIDTVGAVGPMLYYPDGRIQHAGVVLGIGAVAGHVFSGLPRGSGGYFGRAGLEQDLSCVTGACLVTRRSVFEALEGFNEDLPIAFNDVDLCIRLRNAGWRIIWTPQVELIHHESATLGRYDSAERKTQFGREVKLMRDLWGAELDSDPFYNPNLSLEADQFTLAFPPRIAKLPA